MQWTDGKTRIYERDIKSQFKAKKYIDRLVKIGAVFACVTIGADVVQVTVYRKVK